MNNEVVKLPEWTNLKEIATDWEYGSIHSHSEISKILHLEKGTYKYYSMIGRANKELLKHSKILKSVREKGYQTVNPDDFNDYAMGKFKTSKKRFEEGVKVLQNAPVSLMTQDGQRRHRYLYDRSTYRLALENGGLRELEDLNRPKIK